jgi:hypothetical protein
MSKRPSKHTRRVPTNNGYRRVIVNSKIPRPTPSSIVNTQREAYSRVRNNMKENMSEATRRQVWDAKLKNINPLSLQDREHLIDLTDKSLRLSRDNLETIDFLEKKFGLDIEGFKITPKREDDEDPELDNWE